MEALLLLAIPFGSSSTSVSHAKIFFHRSEAFMEALQLEAMSSAVQNPNFYPTVYG
eukprot:c35571_g1_i1 orf=178-345(+)